MSVNNMNYVLINFDENARWHTMHVSDNFIQKRNWVNNGSTIVSPNGKVFQIAYRGCATKVKSVKLGLELVRDANVKTGG